jgi:uncharacterized cupredoxin-like copper-binding protein
VRLTRVLVLPVLAARLAACGGTSDRSTDGHTTGETMADHMSGGMHGGMHGAGDIAYEPIAGAEELRIVATDFAFSPQQLTLSAGEPVNVTVVNDGQLFHDLTLDGSVELHINVEVGEEATSSLVIDQPGTYEAVCSVQGHRDAGMVLMIEVT